MSVTSVDLCLDCLLLCCEFGWFDGSRFVVGGNGFDNLPGEAQFFEHEDCAVGHVEFPPFVAVLGHPLVFVMIVMPAFAVGQQSHPPEIAAVVGRFIVAITPDVSRGVHEPGCVQDVEQTHKHAVDEQAEAQFCTADPVADTVEECAQTQVPVQEGSLQQTHERVFQQIGGEPLMGCLNFLCTVKRNEPEDVAPPATIAGRMRIAGLVAVQVMFTMIGNPLDWRPLPCQQADQSNQPIHERIGLEAAMREQAMIAQADTDAAGKPAQEHTGEETGPGEAERCCEDAQMNGDDPADIRPVWCCISPRLRHLSRRVFRNKRIRFRRGHECLLGIHSIRPMLSECGVPIKNRPILGGLGNRVYSDGG